MSERIAITVVTMGGLDSPLDPRFGRAAAYLVFQDQRLVEELQNRTFHAAHGAGTGAAVLMEAHGVNVVISRRFGPKAHAALEAMGIRMMIAPAGLTAGEALTLYSRGALSAA